MLFPTLYLVIHILFMLGIIVLCTVAAMPTRYWQILGSWGKQRLSHAKGKKLQSVLALQGVRFEGDESFLDRGVGLAIDHKQGLVFLAQPDGKQYQTAIVPKTSLGPHAAIIRQEDGFHRNFVEILETSSPTRKWLIPCSDSDLANEINSRLSAALS